MCIRDRYKSIISYLNKRWSVLRNQDLNLLPIFDALMQEQQLSRAAERLCMSQPAVSNALKRLRISFRDDLFVRTRRGPVSYTHLTLPTSDLV